jgi:multidrug resistance efflux pump
MDNKNPDQPLDSPDSENPEQQKSLKETDPVKYFSKLVFLIILVMFVVYLVTDRLAPYTDQARIQAYVVPMAPQVAGRITKINVKNDEVVEAGQTLFEIDPSDYELAVESAESAFEIAGQEIGASTAAVTTAQSKLVEAQANLAYVIAQSNRVFELEKKKIMSVSEGDKARSAIIKAETQVKSAKSELEKAKQQLGIEGDENPKIRSAIASLNKAQIDLSRTKVVAPAKGGITNLVVNQGNFASVGQPLMTFVDFQNVWIAANFRENSLAHMKPGIPVEMVLDVAPGKIVKGKVISVGFAVDSSATGDPGQLIKVDSQKGWLRDSQRFPVIIHFNDIQDVKGLMRVGGQVDVQVYSTESFLINVFGKIWIRILSYLSYIY